MKKIAAVTVTFLSLIFLSNWCFAQENQAQLTKKIANVMLKSNELPRECFDQAKGNAEEMITITIKNFSIINYNPINFIIVESKGGACCMGARRCAMWVYKKNDTNEKFSKIFGPEYPDEIEPTNSYCYNGKIRGLQVYYPAGNFDPSFSEVYRFDGKQYVLMEKTAGK